MERYNELKQEVWNDIRNLLINAEDNIICFEKNTIVKLNYFESETDSKLIEIQLEVDADGNEMIILTNDIVDNGEWREFDDIITFSLKEMTLVYYMMLKHSLA